MWDKEKILSLLVWPEWHMFQGVEHVGGRASCQDDFPNFFKFRLAQFLTWSDELRSSYASDLILAELSGRNLVRDKYAYMMASTAPDDFSEMEAYLPDLSGEKREKIASIVSVYVAWNHLFVSEHPESAGYRPIDQVADTVDLTSYETYLSAELATYSEKSLNFLAEHVASCLAERRNLVAENMARIRDL